MRREDLVKNLRSMARRILGEGFGHGYPHVMRVLRIAMDITKHVDANVDPFLLEIAILLHDVGRIIGEPHAYYSALIARTILEEWGADREFIDKVVNAILYHSYSYARKHNIAPLTEEAKILSDADKLDALGIVGFLRVFHYSWEHGRGVEDTIRHFYEKIYNLPKLMHYDYTRRLAIKLVERTRRAVMEFMEEIGLSEKDILGGDEL